MQNNFNNVPKFVHDIINVNLENTKEDLYSILYDKMNYYIEGKKKMLYGQDDEDELDPVNKKDLKGKHKDRKDKDIDNDGDVDSSDKYLHKRRKAISKAIKNENLLLSPRGSGAEAAEKLYRKKNKSNVRYRN
tara:strand:- start:38 stop:436 length:399 start_codon:yes stop_codon:yes gene_type:complete